MKLSTILTFSLIHTWMALAMALECPAIQPNKELAPGLTQDKLLTALSKANVTTEKWLFEKSKSLNDNPENNILYGPNLDGTYFYRLGESSVTDNYSFGASLKKQRETMLKNNFPQYQPTEAASIAFINNQARAKAAPKSIRCMKHFPGGNEDTELTEAESVQFFELNLFNKMHEPFISILKTPTAPTCLMIGHAQYKPQFMKQSPTQNLKSLGTQNFDQLPASLNPGITKYLRDDLKFDGLVVADWFNMGAIKQFVKKLNSPYASEFVVTYLAVNAGMDFIPMQVSAAKVLQAAARQDAKTKPVPQSILNELNENLNKSVYETLRRIGAPQSMDFIKNLSLEQKLDIKLTPSQDPFSIEAISPDLYKKLYVHHQWADIWNRTGVMVLLQRQMALETLLNKNEKIPFTFGRPTSIKSEVQWFETLMKNEKFRRAYDQIKWDSDEVQNLFCHVRKNNFSL
ncbi:MAG: hypothetical protein H7256_06005 [Bdellovibrio sp.]|nr:hypothetical protein [Bdellovibrio sp.]